MTKETIEQVLKFRDERNWKQFHNPKDLAIFPDDQHIACINHESGSITFFHVDYEKGLLVMSGRSIRVSEPNSCVIVKVN